MSVFNPENGSVTRQLQDILAEEGLTLDIDADEHDREPYIVFPQGSLHEAGLALLDADKIV